MLLKANEIKEKYRIHHDSLLKWERDGQLQSHRTAGGHRRWLEDDIQGLLKIGVVKEEKAQKAQKTQKKHKKQTNVYLALVIEDADGGKMVYTLEEIAKLICDKTEK